MKDCGGWFLHFIPHISSLEKWQTTLKQSKSLIVQASSIGGPHENTICSIGMNYKYLQITKEEKNIEKYQIGNHTNLVLCAINTTNDLPKRLNTINRKTIVETLHKNNISNIELSPEEYFTSLPSYKFVISPEGSGIDCHRHYEALIAGCIPIVECSDTIVKNMVIVLYYIQKIIVK